MITIQKTLEKTLESFTLQKTLEKTLEFFRSKTLETLEKLWRKTSGSDIRSLHELELSHLPTAWKETQNQVAIEYLVLMTMRTLGLTMKY